MFWLTLSYHYYQLMRKSYFILLLFLGIFLIPYTSFACGSEKYTCEKEVSSIKVKEQSCCDSNSDSDDNGCEGNCGHSKCGCSSTCTSSSTSIILAFKTNTIFRFITSNKINFFYKTPSVLKGYSSIWLIPKIS